MLSDSSDLYILYFDNIPKSSFPKTYQDLKFILESWLSWFCHCKEVTDLSFICFFFRNWKIEMRNKKIIKLQLFINTLKTGNTSEEWITIDIAEKHYLKIKSVCISEMFLSYYISIVMFVQISIYIMACYSYPNREYVFLFVMSVCSTALIILFLRTNSHFISDYLLLIVPIYYDDQFLYIKQ